jgi:transcriptional regulator with XRE-family HTH domain
MIRKILPDQLLTYRLKNNLTWQEMADRVEGRRKGCNISRLTLWKIATGQAYPQALTEYRIRSAFGLWEEHDRGIKMVSDGK